MNKTNFSTAAWNGNFSDRFPQKNYPHSTAPVEMVLKAGIDVCGDVPDMVFHAGVAGGEGLLHLLDGVEHSGVVFVQLLADVGGRQVC